jgi:uncharacterized membrane protein
MSVVARKTGYIESIDGDALLAWAWKHGTIARMERAIGEFVVEGVPLISVAGLAEPNGEASAEVNEIFVISRHRTMQQDAGFGIRQLVDIAMKAVLARQLQALEIVAGQTSSRRRRHRLR